MLRRELADDEGDKNSDHYDGRRMRVCATATDGLPYCTLVLGSLVGSLEVGHVSLENRWTVDTEEVDTEEVDIEVDIRGGH